jgi:putative oxidoreductase
MTPNDQTTLPSVGLLVVRLVVGITFLAHGLDKLTAGLATPLVAAALAIDMLVALLTAHLGHGFFAADGGFELELLLGATSLGIGLAGAGRFSLDAVLAVPDRLGASAWRMRAG